MDSESSRRDNLEIVLHDKIASPRKLPFQYLKEITNNFSAERVVGEGGFGVVYKVKLVFSNRCVYPKTISILISDFKQGVLYNGELMAVKRLIALMPGFQKQFENEVYHLMSLNHPNIVPCVGYCYETQNLCLEYNGKYIFAETAERLLCLEYMPKGSLDNHLTGMIVYMRHSLFLKMKRN
jgi:serine/threonine protein kinase